MLSPAWRSYAQANLLLTKLAAGAQSVDAVVPERPTELWQAVNALVTSVWRAHQPEARSPLAAVAALRPEARTLLERQAIETSAGSGTVARLEWLGFADVLADGQTVRLAPAARSALGHASYVEPDAPVVTAPPAETRGPTGDQAYVFISHASADRSLALRMKNRLTGVSINVRITDDITPHLSIRSAASLEGDLFARLSDEIRNAAVVLFLMSSQSARSEQMRYELDAALAERRRRGDRPFVLPVAVEDGHPRRVAEGFPALISVQYAEAPDGELSIRDVETIADMVHAYKPSERVAPHTATDIRERDYALVIGIERYRALDIEVRNAMAAAHSVAAWLTSDEGGGVPASQLVIAPATASGEAPDVDAQFASGDALRQAFHRLAAVGPEVANANSRLSDRGRVSGGRRLYVVLLRRRAYRSQR